MPRTENQYSEIRETRHQQILDVALELFANQGYHTTSIRKIAETARISKGLIYTYFESKEDLVRSIIHQGIDQMLSIFDQNKDGNLTEDEMTFFVIEYFKIIRNNIPYWKLFFALQTQPAVTTFVAEEYKDYIPDMRAIMINFFRSKHVPHPEMEAVYLSALLDGVTFNLIMDPKYYPVEQIQELILQKISKIASKS